MNHCEFFKFFILDFRFSDKSKMASSSSNSSLRFKSSTDSINKKIFSFNDSKSQENKGIYIFKFMILIDSDSIQGDVVRDYYMSLLKEEYNRQKIVELNENLGKIDEKLSRFLKYTIFYY